MPGGRGHMLRVLSGTQHGWFGKLALDMEFLETLSGETRAPPTVDAGSSIQSEG
jgi:hypothetical protein